MDPGMTVLLHAAIDKPSLPVAGKRGLSRVAYWLIAPGVLWMTLFLVVPILMIVYVSFWTQTTFKIEPILTTRSWAAFFASDTYIGALWTTVRIWLIVLFTTLLVGKEGAINIILQMLHITSAPIDALLFTELSVIIGMTQIYCVFMVGPIAFMLGRIDPNVIEAARDLGASFGRIFRTIILPLSMPGVIVGSIFVSVMVLGEFATASALSGRKVNMLGNIIVTQVGSLKWAFASVVGVILTILMGIVIAGLLRIVDLKREL